MRLIEADEIKQFIHDLMLNNPDKYSAKDMTQYDNLIASCTTVDAIPVAFIEEKKRKYEELAYQSTPKIQQRYFDKAMAIQSLIDYWHEKNEKGDDDATV